MNTTRLFALGCTTLALTFLLSGAAQADTLELRNGSLLKGTYVGGTQGTVRFDVSGQVMTLPVGDVLALTFDTRPAQAEGAATREAPPQAAAQPVQAVAQTAAPRAVMVPGGTSLLVRMRDGVDSATTKAGYRFTAELEAPLSVGRDVVAPKGTPVYGVLKQSKSAGRVAGQAELKLELTDIMIAGQRQPIRSGDYSESSGRQGRNTAGKVVRGAAIGGLIDGSDGAKTGAKVGAGVAILTRGTRVTVPAGALLEFRLLAPFEAPVVGSAPQQASAPQGASVTPQTQASPQGSSQASSQAAGAVIPAGTGLLVRTRESVNSKKHKTGHRFTAVLETPVSVGGRVVAPKGALVYGRLASAKTSGRVRGKSDLSLELTDIMIGGVRHPLLTSDYEAKGDSQGRDTVGKVARGAVIGGLLKGKKGAKDGAKVGAGVAILTRGNQVKVPSGSLLEFRLRAPVNL